MSGCMTDGGGRDPSTSSATAALKGVDGAPRGTAGFSEQSGGVDVTAEVAGLPPGVHGIHVHATGKCEAPDFQSAGAHWNPTARLHGRDNPDGAHHGDLPNITVAADGRGTLRFTLPGAEFAQMLDADGASLVIHAAADDQRTDPSGNSGGRIACGVIVRD